MVEWSGAGGPPICSEFKSAPRRDPGSLSRMLRIPKIASALRAGIRAPSKKPFHVLPETIGFRVIKNVFSVTPASK